MGQEDKIPRLIENPEDEFFSMTPKQVHQELNRFIIGQEHAKKVLSVAVCNHNKRLQEKTGLIKKSNILLAGPSGCGKTLLAKKLAEILDVPFAIADTSSMTEAGYVGEDVEICLQRLIKAAGGNITLAQKGVVFLDEIDKIASSGKHKTTSRDVSRAGVQANLLKLIEGSEVSVPLNGKRKNPEGETVAFDTSNVLFICGGAFEGLLETPKSKNIGFKTGTASEIRGTDHPEFKKLTPESLVEYGLMPELVGRLPVLCTLSELTEDDLVRILTEPEDAITKEYQMLFEKDGTELIFEKDALIEIAKMANANGTGARGLRAILEDVLLDIIYELPEQDIAECHITKDTIHSKLPVLKEKSSTPDFLKSSLKNP